MYVRLLIALALTTHTFFAQAEVPWLGAVVSNA
jgi:hypothetical protein